MRGFGWFLAVATAWQSLGAFHPPTENQALFTPQAEEQFFVGTPGKSWTSGQFGCVRSEERQFHEGIDIRCLHRDGRGEPTDAVRASADGVVAYVNLHSSWSNYGNYVVLRHQMEGLEVYTLYAHLSSVRPGLTAGTPVRAGEGMATMGRTSNTRQRITPDRAHVHFEIDFQVSGKYEEWHRKHRPGTRNDHGEFNGLNLLGIDPAIVLKSGQRLGPGFSLVRHLAAQPEMMRVLIRDPKLPWARKLAGMVQANPLAEKGGIAGYELHLSFNGAPLRIIPRSPAETPGSARLAILSVNETEWRTHPCTRLVAKRGQMWTALPALQDLLGLATY